MNTVNGDFQLLWQGYPLRADVQRIAPVVGWYIIDGDSSIIDYGMTHKEGAAALRLLQSNALPPGRE